MENNLEIAQIDENWQDGTIQPLTGDEEESARDFINEKLQEWEIREGDENLNDYIFRAWDEWVASDEAGNFKK